MGPVYLFVSDPPPSPCWSFAIISPVIFRHQVCSLCIVCNEGDHVEFPFPGDYCGRCRVSGFMKIARCDSVL